MNGVSATQELRRDGWVVEIRGIVGNPALDWSFSAKQTTIVVVTLHGEVPASSVSVVDDDGVDRGLIRRHLAMSPEERLRALDDYLAFFDSVSLVQRNSDGTDPTNPKRTG